MPRSEKTKKHKAFFAHSGRIILNKPVTKLPGIGKVLGQKLAANGYPEVNDLVKKYTDMRNETTFKTWLKNEYKANSIQQSRASSCLKVWNQHKPPLQEDSESETSSEKARESKKRISFLKDPNPSIDNKPVTQLAGVGARLGQKFANSGYQYAGDLNRVYLRLNDEKKFKDWLKSKFNTNSYQQNHIYNCLSEWSKKNLYGPGQQSETELESDNEDKYSDPSWTPK